MVSTAVTPSEAILDGSIDVDETKQAFVAVRSAQIGNVYKET